MRIGFSYSAVVAVCSTTNSDVVFLGEGKSSNTLYGCNSTPADRQTQVVGVVKPAHPSKIS
jgi:hypothetical protein